MDLAPLAHQVCELDPMSGQSQTWLDGQNMVNLPPTFAEVDESTTMMATSSLLVLAILPYLS
jgi:hypothetical protein